MHRLFYKQEHDKRCWSVDFNAMDPNLLASGSDDSKGIKVALSDLWPTFHENHNFK
jgi:WD40 repeat protein